MERSDWKDALLVRLESRHRTMMPSARRNKDPQWGVLRGGVSVNEPFSLGDDWEVKFDVSAIIGGRPHMEVRAFPNHRVPPTKTTISISHARLTRSFSRGGPVGRGAAP